MKRNSNRDFRLQESETTSKRCPKTQIAPLACKDFTQLVQIPKDYPCNLGDLLFR